MRRLHINEDTTPFNSNWKNELADSIEKTLSDNHIFAYVDIDDVDNYTATFAIEIDDGDWKHEHIRADHIVKHFAEESKNIDIVKIGETTIGDSESDTYSSIHKYLVTYIR